MSTMTADTPSGPCKDQITTGSPLINAILDYLYNEPQPLGAIIEHVRTVCAISPAGPVSDTVTCLDSLLLNEWVTVRQGFVCMTPAARVHWDTINHCTHA